MTSYKSYANEGTSYLTEWTTDQSIDTPAHIIPASGIPALTNPPQGKATGIRQDEVLPKEGDTPLSNPIIAKTLEDNVNESIIEKETQEWGEGGQPNASQQIAIAGQPAGSNALDQTQKLSKWSQAVQDGDWGEAAGILAGVATHASKLVSILDGSWAESQKKIIGMGKYHGPGRAWWA